VEPLHLAVTLEGQGFEALLGLRDRLTEHSIFVSTDQIIAPKTRVIVEVVNATGRLELRGGGSVLDVKSEGVIVAVEWEADGRAIVEKILTGDLDPDPPGMDWGSWAQALESGEAAPLAPPITYEPEPDRIDVPISTEALEASWTPSDSGPKFGAVELVSPIDVDAIEIPMLSDSGLVASEEPPAIQVVNKVPPSALPAFDLDVIDSADIIPIEDEFQKIIDETITDDAEADAIVRGRPSPPPPTSPPPPVADAELVAPPFVGDAPPGIADDLRISDHPRAPPTPEARTSPARDLGPKGEVVIGIDLGTTFSCAAIVENGEARVLATRRGRPTVASVVYYDPFGRTVVGESALKKAETEPHRTIIGSKRLMGRPFHSPIVQEVREHFAYEIVQGHSGEAALLMDGKVVSLEEVAAEILRDLREAASLQVEGRLNRAVITCPAYFNERQREAVRVAGELAGFHVERVLNEPTAAALHYGYGKGFDAKKILVYDLGGGTFDVSLMEVNGDVYEVLATGGDSFLGGIDFDACVAEMIAEGFLEEHDIDPRTDQIAVARLLRYAEAAKRDLSTMISTIVEIDHLVVKPYAARSVTVHLKQKRVEAAFDPLVQQTLRIVEEVCARAGVGLDDIHDILLVGGQTRTPLVRRRVAELFGRQPLSSVHPDYAVALGAAQYASSLSTFDSIVLIDALPMSIGVGLPGGRFKKIIERDTRLPVKRKYRLHTTRDDQKSFEILVFQGEAERVEGNEPLGMLVVPKLPKGVRGSVTVDLELEVNEECLLRLTAKESKTGKVAEATFGTKATPGEIRAKLGLPDKVSHQDLEQMKEANRPKGVWRWLTGLFR
jgi:molecular chaperone DnaK